PDVTPNGSALARDGVVFENAYSVYPESIKGLLSVLCSTYPALGTQAEIYAGAPCESLASALREHGYRTALFHSGRFGYLGMDAVVGNRGFQLLADAGDIGGRRESSFGVDEEATVARILEWNDRVPLIVAVPGLVARRQRSDRVVSSIDIAPTLLDIAGIAAPNSYQGTSAIDDNRRMATFFADYSLRLLGLRDGAMKYIRELDSGRSQLFDLRADPGETRNVADRYLDDVRWYAQKLNEWMK